MSTAALVRNKLCIYIYKSHLRSCCWTLSVNTLAVSCLV